MGLCRWQLLADLARISCSHDDHAWRNTAVSMVQQAIERSRDETVVLDPLLTIDPTPHTGQCRNLLVHLQRGGDATWY